jgi:hypothetical protein
MPPTMGKTLEDLNASDDSFELELEYNCSSLTLEQSIKQVFLIVNSVKVPSIERQQLQSLEQHISQLLLNGCNEQGTLMGKRSAKAFRKSIGYRREIHTTLQKSEYAPFDED